MTLDVATFGETMVLFSSDRLVPLEYTHQFYKQIGGAESNVAIGLARLGHQVGWFSKLGNDPFGRYIEKFIRGEGVDTSRCIYTDQAPTAVFFKEKLTPKNINVYYYRKGSAASLLRADELDETYIGSAKMLHLSGITPALSQSAKEAVYKAIEVAKAKGVKIVFDPNIRLKLWSIEEAKPVLLDLIRQADIVLPGVEEGQLITGETQPEKIVDALRAHEQQTFVVKLGAKGAYYTNSQEKGYVPGFTVEEVVDPVGAGDGFAAGVMSGLLRGWTIQEAVRLGNAIGAIVVGVSGDVEGLPYWAEVQQKLEDNGTRQDVVR
ncbi:2-dehydro-3-deoxygluconokinase [Caldalkalibacillus uzonensis]|uniref:2-dehydro-3-deoxygluconokinase n=1 Tax=Caldalkalibacillus uzonensis TaxID=353224 RepID=A0ABU0CPD6_9BACI|nr:sugar kinase [Caldalkalibacillus uzonensis]MDQ0338270.1 2-dehydro-3-deoxygluconokinase [Caldalkalibacillus uzonensis]